MNCPEDSNPLDLVGPDNGQNELEYTCSFCHGRLEYRQFSETSNDNILNTNQILPNPSTLSGEHFRCPRDGDLFIMSHDQLKCPMCHSVWLPGAKSKVTDHQAAGLAAQFVGLAVLGIGLFSWQTGTLTSSADALQSASTAPQKALIYLAWFVIFLILFSIPITIYIQLVQSHRPNLKKVINHSLIRWLPLVVLALMAANIYFLTP